MKGLIKILIILGASVLSKKSTNIQSAMMSSTSLLRELMKSE
jgi:hypothetical protein